MTTGGLDKTFDAVKMMREIRARISMDTKHMTFDQLKKYLDEKTKNSPTKELAALRQGLRRHTEHRKSI